MAINDQVLNRLAVVKAIRRHGPIARSELTGLTGLSGGTISQLTRDLVSRGLVVEKKQDPSGQIGRTGRRRVDLAINARGGVVLGASVGGPTGLTISFVDLAGNNLFSMDRGSKPPRSLEGFALGIAQALQEAIATSPLERDQVSRVGIALPAVVDNERGIVHFMATLGCGSVPFADIISDRLGLPVTIENEMVCMARAEHWFGRAQGLDTFTLIHLGLWLGSAEYVNAAPRIGASGFALELGHCATGADEHALLCTCGAYGCLATYCSMHGIVAQAGQLGDKLFLWPSELRPRFERLLEDAGSGGKARALFDRAGRQLGIALAAYVNTVDPGNILLLYSHQRFFELIRPSYEKELHAHALGAVLRQTRIEAAPVDEQWRLTGTAALALEQAFVNRMAA